jgi:predicted deacylase
MPIDIVMPAFAPTMEKGNLIQWLKAVGDRVRSGEVLAEIETDKATMEVEASADGVLSRRVRSSVPPIDSLSGDLTAASLSKWSLGCPAIRAR